MSIINKLKEHRIFLAIFHLVFLLILFINFPYGKYFIGWDALNPEFNFPLNFSRTFTAFWQENQGLGLLGGHGFAAVLPHNIITFVLSLIFPISAIRPVFTFLGLYVGGLGMYFLSSFLLSEVIRHKKWEKLNIYTHYVALLSSLFYMLNLGTLQMFYIQLEAFVFHYASLPWLFIIAINLIQKPNKKNLVLFFFINFISSTQGFIPPLFVAYIFALVIFLLIYLYKKKFDFKAIKKIIVILVLTFVINAYWLIPLSYYTVTRSQVYLNSYNNLMSTPEFINKNKKYGDIKDVALIKGFIFESTGVFEPWVTHQNNNLVKAIGYLFFALIAFGLIYSVIAFRNRLINAFAGVFLFFFTGLTTDFFPFSLLTRFFQEYMPIYRQAFRAAFTKFSIGVSFSYSIFLGIGMLIVLLLIIKLLKKRSYLIIIFFFIALFYYSFPYFKGNFLYNKLTLQIPKTYLEIADFFKNKEDARIADFPQDCPEGWFNYLWGYTGSGFYWYMIKQPILSRTFDVWSNYNENYYWEIAQALREEDFAKTDALFQKYNVKWILYDPNIIHCRNQKAFSQHDAFIKNLNNSENYNLLKTFNSPDLLPIRIYENIKENTKSFITLKNNLPNIGPKYSWNDDDRAYYENNDYTTTEKQNYDLYYPFRTLFDKRRFKDKEFEITTTDDSIVLETIIPNNLIGYPFNIKSITSSEKIMPVSLRIDGPGKDSYSLYIKFLYPEIDIDNQELFSFKPEIKLGEFKTQNLITAKLLLNGTRVYRDNQGVYKSYFSLKNNNVIKLNDENEKLILRWESDNNASYKNIIEKDFTLEIPNFNQGILNVRIPKINNSLYGFNSKNMLNYLPKPCNEITPSNRNKYEYRGDSNVYLRMTSQNSRQCLILNLQSLSTGLSYVADVETRNIAGSKLNFYVAGNTKMHYLDTFIEATQQFEKFYYVLPATSPNEAGYDLYVDNISQNNDVTVNDLKEVSLYYIPYEFIKNIKIGDYSKLKQLDENPEVNHINTTLYMVKFNSQNISDNSLLTLSQSFDPAWKAYYLPSKNPGVLESYFPFLSGQELKDHILVNNWTNGWEINSQLNQSMPIQPNTDSTDSTIVILFWPQYLEYIGFFFLVISFLIVIKKKIKV